MIVKKAELEYCMKCGQPNPPDRAICECGGRNFAYGNDFTFTDRIICNCGSDKFQMVFHMNMNPIYEKTYKCSNCGNLVGVQVYCEGY